MLKKINRTLDIINPANFTVNHTRILSIDALRGFDMFWITGGSVIFVNLDMAVKSPTTNFLATQMEHVDWTGFHFYDIIMPLFLFITGVSLPMAVKRRLQNFSKAYVWKHVLKRVAILWFLGMMVQGNLLTYNFSRIAFFSNTLQAIAAGYIVATVFVLYLNFPQQLAALLFLLVINYILLQLPVPGTGIALRPDHNFAMYVDKLILGTHQDGTTYTWILTSIGFAATVITGLFASYILQSPITGIRKVRTLFITGFALIVAGLIVGIFQPIIKHVWTSAFVFFTSGICFALLSFFYLIIDEWKYTKWARFFIVLGSNSIAAYILSDLFDFGFNSFADVFLIGLKTSLGSWYPFANAVGAYIAFWLIFYHLYKQKIFIRI